jgi:peptidoglycan hydrolase CwlO-like protein
MAATISLKDHIAQTGELEKQKAELAEQVETLTQEHQTATELATNLREALEREEQAHAATTEQTGSLRDELARVKDQHAAEIKRREAEFEESVKQGVIDALAEQGREPVQLGDKPAKEIYGAQEVIEMTPGDRAEVMRKVREGKAELTD